MARLEELGDSELAFILEKVSDREDRKSCSEVCKQWYRVESITRSSLHIKHPDHLHKILPRFPNILSFRLTKGFSDSQLEFLSKTCPNLQRLWLRFFDSLDQILKGFGDTGIQAIATNCPNLTHVEFTKRKSVGDIGVISLIQSCPNLVLLDMEACVRLTNKSLQAIGALGTSKLCSLNLNRCAQITDVGLAALAKGSVARRLKILDVARCHQITDNGVLCLKEMCCLEELSLAHCGPRISDIGGVAVSAIRTLKRLNLGYLKNVTDVTLVAVSRNCVNLVYVNVLGCELVTEAGVSCFRPEVIGSV